MGYYTRYKLELIDDTFENIIPKFRKENTSATTAFYDTGHTANETKWHSHEPDMRKLSKKHPTVLFVLKGEGEDTEDLWVKYFKNGKMQECRAKIVYDAFDESKLH